MTDIDDKIRAALRHEDAELLEHFRGEASLPEMLIDTFRGRHWWINVIAVIGSLVALAILILAAYQFFHATEVRDMIAWATGFVWCLISIAMLKIWFWMEIQRNSLTREIKRLELQVANLSRQLVSSK